MDALDKRTHKLLRAAIHRAQQAFKGGQINLALRNGESLLNAGNLIGIKSKDILILAIDTNQNGLFFDARDRILISAEGITAILDNKCAIIKICKDVVVADRIKRASKMLGTGQSGMLEATVNETALKELAKVVMQTIAAVEQRD